MCVHHVSKQTYCMLFLTVCIVVVVKSIQFINAKSERTGPLLPTTELKINGDKVYKNAFSINRNRKIELWLKWTLTLQKISL